MQVKFATADKTYFVVNTEDLTWARVGSMLTADNQPSVIEEGRLVPQGRNVYVLGGRTPKSAPGNGLASVVLAPVVEGVVCTVYVRGNVPLQDVSLPVPIETVRATIIPEFEVPQEASATKPAPAVTE